MGFGEPTIPTPEEQAKIQKEREESDKELVEGGAEITADGKILATDEQVEEAKEEMDQKKTEAAIEGIITQKLDGLNEKFGLSEDNVITKEEMLAQYWSLYEIQQPEGGNSLTHRFSEHAENKETGAEIIEAVGLIAANMAIEKLQSEKTGDNDEEIDDKISKIGNSFNLNDLDMYK